MSEDNEPFTLPQSPAYLQGHQQQTQRPIFWSSLACIVIAIGGVFFMSLHHQTSPTVSSTSGTSGTPSAVVSITAQGFIPATISVQQGQAVSWLNLDDRPHQPASDPYPVDNGLAGFIDASPLNDADSYDFRFTHVGVFTYHDQLNPFQFKGTVIVRP